MSKANFECGASDGATGSGVAAAAAALHERASRHYLANGHAEAAGAARSGILLDPGRHALVALRAFALQRLGDVGGALADAARATVLGPGHGGSWRLRGALAHVRGRRDEARLAGRRALLLDPADATAAVNVFANEREGGDWGRAVAAGGRARVLDPGSHRTALDLGMLLLALGRWSEGWPLYDRRLLLSETRLRRDRLPLPHWDGRADPTLTLVVWCDQNVGDEMQFARLLPEVADRVGRVVLECDPRLAALFGRSFPGIEVVPRADPPDARLAAPAAGAQIAQGDLGRLLRPDAASFARGPRTWLVADRHRTEVLRQRYRAWGGGRPVIGVAWRSANRAFQGKNIPLVEWAPVLRVPEALFLSVQYGEVAADLAAARAAAGVAVAHDPEVDALADLDGFACQLAAVDLVIAISNSTIHQACGLGRPTWGLLHVRPDWRWGLEERDSLWFPSLTLYRQTVRGRWTDVLEQVGRDLRRWLADRPGAC